ncbi:N-acetylmuramoyl-L-alanine amidase [Leptolyngbya sp. FACHB-261]|uniref:N-acetylmuramoyl-L-alanine amidase n=1 Tax=Leptolyngbya sp. FACHB-261 TaxID=2692806 RepID=UPI0016832984|nr:N-acetylmuramoyl-L-alanine amidase [Leptolyngbya sp. FACHB-261]MBD2100531.1 N-acetylmuramoyl-L-alanine amidase [Leptolyngbya sp. FACHB-261]
MRRPWLLKAPPVCFAISILSTLVWLPKAWAGQLQSWQFDPNQSRLEVVTDTNVQPQVVLIANPTRIVMDLPGTILPSSAITRAVGGAVREIRVAQFDGSTTRLVIELDPRINLAPTQIQVQAAAANRWIIQLPRFGGQAPAQNVGSIPATDVDAGADFPSAELQGIQATNEGFFLRVRGQPQVSVRRITSPDRVVVDLVGAVVSDNFSQRELAVNRYGVVRVRVGQYQASPPIARVVLDVDPTSSDWEGSYNAARGGVSLAPAGGVADATLNPQVPQGAAPAQIQAITLDSRTGQLLIQADRPLYYASGWDPQTGAYRLSVSPAQLPARVQGPRLTADSPLERIRLRQDGPRTVTVLVQPAAGFQVRETTRPGPQAVALQFQQAVAASPPLQSGIGNRRPVVIIDPGHGGPDPGAVGIAGQEKDIVLSIGLQVGRLLQAAGVQAVMTRNSDIDLDLAPRVQLAQQVNATLFVSIHANALDASRSEVQGVETYYLRPDSERLASVIHSNVIQATRAVDRGVLRARFYVVRETTMPSVLVETGFVTSSAEGPRLASPAYQTLMARAIARGILQYLQEGRR